MTDPLTDAVRLQLAERTNAVYQEQLKKMKDHLVSFRSLINDKENIMENLMLRYDLGILTEDKSRQNGNIESDEIDRNELRRKADALAIGNIMENCEIRDGILELSPQIGREISNGLARSGRDIPRIIIGYVDKMGVTTSP